VVMERPADPAPDDDAAVAAVFGRMTLFARCSTADVAEVVRESEHLRFAPGADIVREGEEARHLFLIEEGEVVVLKAGSGAPAQHEIARLGAGRMFGEMALMDPGERSATVRAVGPVRVMAIPIAAMVRLSETRPGFTRVFVELAREVVSRLRQTNSTTVASLDRALEEEKTRVTMGRFLLSLIVAYSLYTFLLGTASRIKEAVGRSEMVSIPVIIVTAGILISFMRRSGYPPRFFGLTLRQAPRHTLEAVVLTLPMMALTVVLKLYLVTAVPAMRGAPVFQMLAPAATASGASQFNPMLALAYCIFIPFQELIYRGGLQGALEHFLGGRPARWRAIFASNIIFSAGHLYISPGFAGLAFFTGLFWGWLYARQRGLAGVSVSHILLGIWALDVVDLGVLE